MSAVELFSYGSTDVRTVVLDGEPWFVAADVCAVLAIANPHSSVALLDDDERGLHSVETLGGPQSLATVNEPGLYSLILRSRKPEAKAFKRWITHEVLPQIRRTGQYGAAPALPDITTPTGVLAMAEQFAATARQLVATQAQVAELEPAAASWNTLATADGDFLVADAAKILSRDSAIKIGQNRLYTLLSELRWIYRGAGDGRWRTYQTAIETGRLSEMPMSHYHPRTGELVLDPPQIRITVKGIEALRTHLTRAAA
ncbi:BRO family protein [Pseudonocardia pini]|uniref:BRO family protein n=1 Tax=Pseudonocardia pini TaxID=2758030 RepID=UPI001C688784|nr:BRO family protein [Pseudonocardia pini]